jgi:cytosine/adenosine deaminase-related metal-dependent hydrolase
MDFLLKNPGWHNGIEQVSADIRISKGNIVEIGNNLGSKKGEHVGNFQNHFIYPGLINAHDHLEMNLYPKLGTPPYNNYVEWAKDIYHPSRSPLREIEKVDIQTRLLWGGLKNLIAGATTVIHHNPWHPLFRKREFPVNVVKTFWAHSLAFEKELIKKAPRQKDAPFVIHAGEGIDQFAFSEIPALDSLGLLKENTVLIHAIALNDQYIEILSNNHTSVVWCPSSNEFMFNQTAPAQKLKDKVKVALGSDSTLTGAPTLLHEMKSAFNTKMVSTKDIYEMVSNIPSHIFKLPYPRISPGYPANLFIAPIKHEDYFENVLNIQPADISLVLTNGIPRVKNAENDDRWLSLRYSVKVQGISKYCDMDVSSLKKKIEKKVGIKMLERNPLWNLIET